MAKWKKRTAVAELPTGPRRPRSIVLSSEYEAAIVAFRTHTQLSLADCLYALHPTGDNVSGLRQIAECDVIGRFDHICSAQCCEQSALGQERQQRIAKGTRKSLISTSVFSPTTAITTRAVEASAIGGINASSVDVALDVAAASGVAFDGGAAHPASKTHAANVACRTNPGQMPGAMVLP